MPTAAPNTSAPFQGITPTPTLTPTRPRFTTTATTNTTYNTTYNTTTATLIPTRLALTTSPSAASTSLPSVPPSTAAPVISLPANPAEAIAYYLVQSAIVFSELDIGLFDNATLAATFLSYFISQMAAAAELDTSEIAVTSILPSSVTVISDTRFAVRSSSSNASSPALDGAHAFRALVAQDAGGIFTDQFFATMGEIWSNESTMEGFAATSPPVMELLTSEGTMCEEGSGGCADLAVTAADPCLQGNSTGCARLELGVEQPPPLADPCDVQGVCSTDPPVQCIVDPFGAARCAECPSGYEGNGVTCLDVDECIASGSGSGSLCDPRAGCVNEVGTYHCGGCPEGWRGSGDTQCREVTSCSEDHGGCDPLLRCVDQQGGRSKCEGECPMGLEENTVEDPASELSHCVDVDGCAEAPCYPGVPCRDLPAPSLGRSCGPCPMGFIGDGEVCEENRCFYQNGGCDPRTTCTSDPSAPGGRVCSACPVGFANVAPADGTGGPEMCGNADWCVLEPCFPGVECWDRAIPEEGRTCGACPPGYIGDGVKCEDVDECAESNGGCWTSADGILLSRCVNLVGSHECGPCAVEAATGSLAMGWMGSGRTGCVMATGLCSENNGGCWVGEGVYAGSMTTCSQEAGMTQVTCGACPTGFEGRDGASGCSDEDGCALEPCFPGVQCTDTVAPGTGRYCGLCPEGYKGDGAECEMCTMETTIKGSTAMNGVMRRSYTNEVIAALSPGLSDPNCTNTQGVGYLWRGGSSGGKLVELASLLRLSNDWRIIGQAMTLRLPRNTLVAGESYTIQMAAFLLGNLQVESQNRIEFLVQRMPLVAQLLGGDTLVSEGALVVLDASGSYDPNTDDAALGYAWTCRRSDLSAAPCRLSGGAQFPERLVNASLALRLQGDLPPAGAVLTFGVTVTSGVLSASASANVVVVTTGALPTADAAVHTLASPPPGKMPPNQGLSLVGTVVSEAPETLRLEWSAWRQVAVMRDADGSSGAAARDAVDLAAVALTPLNGTNLVVPAGTLQAGATYVFKLAVEDAYGAAYKTETVLMNTPPSGGRLEVWPREGLALNTSFTMSALEWYDEDFPLWFEIVYQVVGAERAVPRALAAMQGFAGPFVYVLPEGGLEEWGSLVNITLLVRDSLGALAVATNEIRVAPAKFESLAARSSEADALLDAGTTQLRNGQADMSVLTLDTAAAVLQGRGEAAEVSAAAPEARGAAFRSREQQRSRQVELAAGAVAILPADSTSVQRLTSSVAAFVDAPAEVSNSTRGTALSLIDALVSSTLLGSNELVLWDSTAATVCDTLSSLTDSDALEGATPANGSTHHIPGADTAAALGTLDLAGRSLLQTMVAGQEATRLSSSSLSLSVQREELASDQPAAWRAEVPGLRGAPHPAQASFPASMSLALLAGGAGGVVDTVLLSSAHDPHLAQRRNASGGGAPTESSGGSASVMTAIKLKAASDGSELSAQNLQEAFDFTLPLTGASAPETELVPVCSFWSEAAMAYMDTGCATLPTLAPAGARLYWATRNASELLWGLQGAWEVGNESYYLSGCRREHGAWFPQYEGRDAGYRKYVPTPEAEAEGSGCVVAEEGNEVGCWWRWQAQAFLGPGCVRASEVSCLCNHLTDFMAVATMPPGEPSMRRAETASLSDMASVSADDLADSMVLLLLLGTIMGAGLLTFMWSNMTHDKERFELLTGLFIEKAGFSFREIGGLWTWSIMEDNRTFAGRDLDIISRAEVDGIVDLMDICAANEDAGALVGTSAKRRKHKERLSQVRASGRLTRNSGFWRGAFGQRSFNVDNVAKSFANQWKQKALHPDLRDGGPQQRALHTLQEEGLLGGGAGTESPGSTPNARRTRQRDTVEAASSRSPPRKALVEKPGAGEAFDDVTWLPTDPVVLSMKQIRCKLTPPTAIFSSSALSLTSQDFELQKVFEQTPRCSIPENLAATLSKLVALDNLTESTDGTVKVKMDGKERSRLQGILGQHSAQTTPVRVAQTPRRETPLLEPSAQGGQHERRRTPADASGGQRQRARLNLQDIPQSSGCAPVISPASSRRRQARRLTRSTAKGTARAVAGPVAESSEEAQQLHAMHGQVDLSQLLLADSEEMHEAEAEAGRSSQGEAGLSGRGAEGTRQSALVRLQEASKALWWGAMKRMSTALPVRGSGIFLGQRGKPGRKKKPSPWRRCKAKVKGVRDFFLGDNHAATEALMDQLKRRPGQLKPLALCKALGINVLRLQACIPIMDMTVTVLNLERGRLNKAKSKQDGAKSLKTHRCATGGKRRGGGVRSDGKEEVSDEVMMAVKRSLCTLGQSITNKTLQAVAEEVDKVWYQAGIPQEELLKALGFDRMLGTALVHSYLHAHRLVRYEEMTKQAALAEMIPWEKSMGRSFTWYVSVMIEIMRYVKTDGWYRRAMLFNLVFLQSSEGGFTMTQTLANLLYAGSPEQELSLEAIIPQFPLENLISSIPPRLSLLCNYDSPLTQEIWATLCAIACYDLTPFDWVHDPLAPPMECQTLGERAVSWLEEACTINGLEQLKQELPELRAKASGLVGLWDEEHTTRINMLYARENSTRHAVKFPTILDLPAWLWRSFTSLLRLAFRTHPLAQILVTPSTDPFTRAERIILQTTIFIMMLLFCMAFYYSRALGCCLLLQEHLGCPLETAASTDTAACLGATSCAELHTISHSHLLPMELMRQMTSFSCNAFPSPSWIGRLEAVMVMVVCLLPVNVLLSALFGTSNASNMSLHWRPAPRKQRYRPKQAFAWLTPAIQAIGFAVYGLLLNAQILNKALAMLLVLSINLVANPARRIKDTISSINDIMLRTRTVYLRRVLGRSFKEASPGRVVNGRSLSTFVSSFVELWTSWLAYCLVGVLWGLCTWVLLTYGMLIRRMMGEEAEAAMLETFGFGLLMEQFGVEAGRLVVLRVFVAKVVNFISTMLDHQAPMQHWYEIKVHEHLTKELSKHGIDDDEFDEENIDAIDVEISM
ncbi:hypothetical protein CYMTET_42451 [Cymbomonas tetramitiformis]|uniref:EGF-like domain-containing protein n=1 Tax=Cymbomonas tetramitiformis TaxID=36881 RepID=A0AAE0C563_9CHLO|nr:hypothetical protein CYMTET_42451 [Cymbomonas tetramitiformis]